MRKRQFLFRLFYSTSFSILLIIEILLLLISPGDIIYQSFAANRRLSIIAVAIVYVAVLLVSTFIIATRFYTAHTQLTAIPKTHVPIRKEDLSKSLRKLIDSELSRSASIAYYAHPRSINEEEIQALAQEHTSSRTIALPLDHMKSWTEIQHPGWSSPCATDLPDLQFEPVLSEFPNLLEAKAVSLVSENVVADPWIVELLQRPVSVSLRDYLERLGDLHMIDITETTGEFIKDYERSRFSSLPISEKNFGKILEGFTSIIQSLRQPSDEALQRFVPDFNSLNRPSRPNIISRSSKSSSSRALKAKKITMNKKRPEHDNMGDIPASLTRSSKSLLATQPHIYQASISSGHAGDCSSDSSDSENLYSGHSKHILPKKHSQDADLANPIHIEATSEGARQPSEVANISSFQDNDGNDVGSVIRRTITGVTDGTNESIKSRKSWSSVIRREDQGESTLPLPMVNDFEQSNI